MSVPRSIDYSSTLWCAPNPTLNYFGPGINVKADPKPHNEEHLDPQGFDNGLKGLGFSVLGLGFRVFGLGSRV